MINLEHIKNYLAKSDDVDPELKKEHEVFKEHTIKENQDTKVEISRLWDAINKKLASNR
jgi:hypothetical protein